MCRPGHHKRAKKSVPTAHLTPSKQEFGLYLIGNRLGLALKLRSSFEVHGLAQFDFGSIIFNIERSTNSNVGLFMKQLPLQCSLMSWARAGTFWTFT